MADRLGFVVASAAAAPAKANAVEPDPLKGGDVHQWAMDQSALIRAGRYGEIDWVNVADEIESVGKSEFRSLASNLEVVLGHMLKWDHQPARRSRSWINSIEEHRDRVATDLSENPSLKPRQDEAIKLAYRHARYAAERETGLSRQRFPDSSPYEWDEIMNRPFVFDPTDEVP